MEVTPEAFWDWAGVLVCLARSVGFCVWTGMGARLCVCIPRSDLGCACDSQVGFVVVAWCCVVSFTGSMISGVMCLWKWFVAQQKSCRALSLLECPQWSVTSAVGFGAACGDNICVQLLISCLGTITLKVVGYFVRIIILFFDFWTPLFDLVDQQFTWQGSP